MLNCFVHNSHWICWICFFVCSNAVIRTSDSCDKKEKKLQGAVVMPICRYIIKAKLWVEVLYICVASLRN